MPLRAPRPCKAPGCGALASDGAYCPAHESRSAQDKAVSEARRPSAAARGYDHRWRKVRDSFLRRNPLCAKCGKPASVVDHVVPHKGDWILFWKKENWQALCERCHNVKTATADGGFNNAPVSVVR